MSLKKWIRAVLNFIALIPPRSIRQMLANFSGAEFKKRTVPNSEEKKKKVLVPCSLIPNNTWSFFLKRRSRETKETKCTKRVMHV